MMKNIMERIKEFGPGQKFIVEETGEIMALNNIKKIVRAAGVGDKNQSYPIITKSEIIEYNKGIIRETVNVFCREIETKKFHDKINSGISFIRRLYNPEYNIGRDAPPVTVIENTLTDITEYLSWIIGEQRLRIDALEYEILRQKKSYAELSDKYDRVSFDLDRICSLLPENKQAEIKSVISSENGSGISIEEELGRR
jgi:hypothetical protein